MPLKLLHTADIHLGAHFNSLGAYSAERQKEFQQTFSRIIDLAIERSIPLLLIAGDLFDDIEVDRSLVGWTCEELRRYSQHRGHTVILPGTHDHMEGGNWALKSLMNVYLLDSPTLNEPLKLTIEDQTVFLYGFAYCHGQTPEDWRPMMQRRDAEGYHIGLLHGSLRKNREWTIPEKDVPFTILDLAELNLDYIALGHFHQPEIFENEGRIIASYSGSPEGKQFKEEGERVVHIISLNESQGRAEIEQISVQTKRLKQVTIDLGGIATLDDLKNRISSEGREDLIAKITLTGVAEFPIETEDLEQEMSVVFSHLIVRNETTLIESSWVEKLKSELTIRGAFIRRAIKELEEAKTIEDRTRVRMAMNEVLAEFQRSRQ